MKPEIILTTADIERLEALIDSMSPGSAISADLLEELARAQVVEPHEIPPSVVTMNSTVRFTVGPGNEEFCRILVYPKEVRNSTTISVLSPVGSALLGLSIGDSISWPGPTGESLSVHIVDVIRQPESKGGQ